MFFFIYSLWKIQFYHFAYYQQVSFIININGCNKPSMFKKTPSVVIKIVIYKKISFVAMLLFFIYPFANL